MRVRLNDLVRTPATGYGISLRCDVCGQEIEAEPGDAEDLLEMVEQAQEHVRSHNEETP